VKIVKNTSSFDTVKLKSLFTLIHRQIANSEGKLPQWNALKVAIRNKSYGYSGRAYLGKVYGEGWDMFLSVSDGLGLAKLSQLFAHELMHSYGYNHHQYNRDPLTDKQIAEIESKFNIEDLKKVDEAKKPINVVAKNYKKLKSRKDNLLKKQKQYESNLKRVANSLKKVERSIAQYEKKYDAERLTAKFSDPVERKAGKHPKQKLAELCEQHEWLRAERDEEWEGELRIDVWDNRIDNWFEGEMYEDMRDAGGSWKGAYEFALCLVEEDKET